MYGIFPLKIQLRWGSNPRDIPHSKGFVLPIPSPYGPREREVGERTWEQGCPKIYP